MSSRPIFMNETIKLRGVRVHNLRGIDLDLPLNRLIIVTGVSGSGKSSLAFDTLYAEGQRRYLESLSAYARQFLERMDKPEADLIEGIPPAVAIQQKAATKNPRSTVATVTEIYDFLRVFYARVGTVHCGRCGRPLHRDTVESVVETLLKLPEGSKIFITFAWPPDKGPSWLKKHGFYRLLRGREIVNIDALKPGSKTRDGEILVDRLALDPEERDRLADSVELGLKNGGGRIQVVTESGRKFLFSEKLECRSCGVVSEEPYPNLFSFNSPQGACPECHGFGDRAVIDEDKVIPDQSLSLAQGAVEPWTKPVSRGMMRELLREARRRRIPTGVPFRDLKKEWRDWVIEGDDRYGGVRGFFDWLETRKYKVQVRVFLSRYRKFIPCPACGRTRLNPQALNVKVGGRNIGQVTRMTVKEAGEFLDSVRLTDFESRVGDKLIQEIRNRLRFLLEVGLDYITLDRMTFTLSGGEAQRINLAAALGSSLVGTLFVLDEPSIGLHARDNARLVEILKSLRDVGNTVVVVEHDPEIIRAADYALDLGPRAGEHGGRLLFAGALPEFLVSRRSLTAAYLRGEKRIPLPSARRRPAGFLTIQDAHEHNLQHLDVRLPLNVLSCVTGVSGSGKSTLLHDVLYRGWDEDRPRGFRRIAGRAAVDKLIMVDQSPLSTSPRSIPATYTKAMDEIRMLFSRTREARALGLRPGDFSFNTPGGRCEECKGEGQRVVEMQFLSDVVLTCEACRGRRFRDEVLEVRFQGRNIHEVLRMSVDEAVLFFAGYPRIVQKITPLRKVGLGYLRLGQPTTTLSGGELQRIKLAFHLVHERKKRILYLFDEPTIGLHLDDISTLLQTFQELVAQGHSVCIIEHNLDVIKSADYVIDLGPGGGENGGRIVAEGPPEEIVRVPASVTGYYLKKYLRGDGSRTDGRQPHRPGGAPIA
jgi:excinuclease ABC subunit A